MAKKSIFDPTNNDAATNSGLDRYMAPPAQSYSQIPEQLVDGETAESDAVDPELARQHPAKPAAESEPVDEIREALDEREADESVTDPDDTPG